MCKTYLRKYNIPKLTRYNKSRAQREYGYSYKCLHQKRTKINNLTLSLKELQKEQTKPNASRKK